MKPVYIEYADASGDVRGFACIISIGYASFKCGLVTDGPVFFHELGCPKQAAEAFVGWLRDNGFAFVRVSHNREPVMATLRGLPEAVSLNALPFAPIFDGELAVNLDSDNTKMLAGFQQVARQEIKRSRQAGCSVMKSHDVHAFRKLWPIYARRAKEKSFTIGSLRDYESMFALSPREDLVRVYCACYGDKAAYSVVFLREHSTVHYFLAALDVAALGSYPTPSCFLLWEAMQDYRGLGCKLCNLGGGSGTYYGLKRKFHPCVLPSPISTTIVLRPVLYRLWVRLGIPMRGAAAGGFALWRAGRR